jgi:hypothetical protein
MNKPTNEQIEAVDSNGKPFDPVKVERASMLLVDLHPLLDYHSARRIVENANNTRPIGDDYDARFEAAPTSALGQCGTCGADYLGECPQHPRATSRRAIMASDLHRTFQQDPRIHAMDGECACGAKSCPQCGPAYAAFHSGREVFGDGKPVTTWRKLWRSLRLAFEHPKGERSCK